MIKLHNYFNNIYLKLLDYLSRKNSWKFLGFLSFIESIFFPIPPDLMLVPMILADRKKTMFLVKITTIFSVIGGIFGYFIGLYLWDVLSPHIFNWLPSFNEYFSEEDVSGNINMLALEVLKKQISSPSFPITVNEFSAKMYAKIHLCKN